MLFVTNSNMKKNIFLVFIILVTIYSVKSQSYSAGVVVYRPVSGLLTPDEVFRNNTMSYIDLIKQNKNKVDILVFPEFGLTKVITNNFPKEHLHIISSQIGNVSDEICIKSKSQNKLNKLGCAAKENGIYVILNLLEKAGQNYYITTVGLDPAGNLCLKCRKNHLVNGSIFENNPDEKPCTFTAKFKKDSSVSFTVLFGNDIVYPIPAAIKTENVIMTSSIINTLPLNVGFSMYQGFTFSNNINLLVSGYYESYTTTIPHFNYGGSGIYYANGSSIVAFKPDGPESEVAGSLVLRADIPIKRSSESTVQVQSRVVGEIPKMNSEYLNIPGLNNTSKIVQNCSDPKKCCHFKAELTDDTIGLYKWIVLANKTTIVDQEVDIFLCALVAPSTIALKTFKNITISSIINKSKISQTLPLALGSNILPINFTYNADDNELILSKEGNVAVFGILHILKSTGAEPGAAVTLTNVIPRANVVVTSVKTGDNAVLTSVIPEANEVVTSVKPGANVVVTSVKPGANVAVTSVKPGALIVILTLLCMALVV